MQCREFENHIFIVISNQCRLDTICERIHFDLKSIHVNVNYSPDKSLSIVMTEHDNSERIVPPHEPLLASDKVHNKIDGLSLNSRSPNFGYSKYRKLNVLSCIVFH